MEKIKTRWRKNYLEGDNISNNNDDDTNHNDHRHHHHHHNHNHHHTSSKHSTPPTYEPLVENLYLDRRKNEHSRSRKDARYMVCDCILTKEERARGIMGCLDDCLNRMLMIECGPKCTLGDHCLNKRFQKCQSAKVEVFKTRKKGWGLRATQDLPANSFIMEYVGEVVRSKEFRSRVKKYTKQKIKHHYFMALRSDEIIDATVKGNLTRFINHSCEPNCETQKWTVNGDLRIGFFNIRPLQAGEEVTFDYQFQRYGRKAQKCYCEAPSCRGYIGGNEQTFSLNSHSSPQLENKTSKKSFKHGLLLDLSLEDKINALLEEAAQGLKTRDQVIALASLSIKAEEVSDRRKLLDIIKATKSEISLRLFVDYHGLEIICLWMRDPQADCDFKATIIDILERLPIPNKTKVLESNVYRMIERWATGEPKVVLQPTPENHDLEQAPQSPTQPTSLLSPTKLTTPTQPTNSPNIKALAGKLLKKFQALSPGFKIPRLNRLQRIEIEKKMDEEVIKEDKANNDKLGFDQKNPFANRNYFKTNNTNGVVKTEIISKTATALANKRKFDSLTTNNIDLTPAPKISKEEHRQQFEMHVRLKDYYDTIEKYYGPVALEQIQLSQRAFHPINGLSYPPRPPIPCQNFPYLGADHHLAMLVAQAQVQQQQQQQQQQQPSILTTLAATSTTPVPDLGAEEPMKVEEPIKVVEAVKPQPTNLPTSIVLANHSIEPALTIDDELAFSICDYDEYYSIRDKPLSVEDVIDNSYPCPGSYYTTPNGETWFATVSLDRKTQQPQTVILNLQLNSDATSPNKLNTAPSYQQMASANAPSSTDTQESPTTNNFDKMPGKIKKKMFEHGVSKFIKDALSDYYKPDCQLAKITSKEDFVFLARKLTLAVLEKELNRKGGCERLECNKQVKRKVDDFVRIYMAKFGKLYTRHNKI